MGDAFLIQNIQDTAVILDGSTEALAAPSAVYLVENDINTNGTYWIKPEAYTGNPFEVYIDFNGSASGITDSGPWMRIEYSADRFTEGSPWAGTGNTSLNDSIAYSGDFSFTKTTAEMQALLDITTETRTRHIAFARGSVGWTYGINNNANDYQGCKAFDGTTFRGNGSADGGNMIVRARPASISYSFSNLNTFTNSGSDPTDANDATWRNGTIYIREVGTRRYLPLRGIYNGDVDGSTEQRYFPLATQNSYTWVK